MENNVTVAFATYFRISMLPCSAELASSRRSTSNAVFPLIVGSEAAKALARRLLPVSAKMCRLVMHMPEDIAESFTERFLCQNILWIFVLQFDQFAAEEITGR